jgi:hypothetical protein
MKDKCFVYYASPCSVCLADPEVRTFEDAQRRGPKPCPFLEKQEKCSPPRFGCVAVAGARMARSVLQFYTEASEANLALDREFFRRRGPLPPKDVEAYIDTAEHGYRLITDPELVVERVGEYARAVLGLEEGERVPRVPGRFEPPAKEVLAAFRHEGRGRRARRKIEKRAKPPFRPGLRRYLPVPRMG